jgi:hypothetical protein
LNFVLRENAKLKVRYSPKERRIFAALPHDGTRINSRALTSRLYGREVPFNGRVIVVGTVRSLQRKMIINEEKVIIHSTPQSGPFPIEFWVAKVRGWRVPPERRSRRNPSHPELA